MISKFLCNNKRDLYFYVILVLFLFFLYVVKSVLAPFVISIIIAFLFKNLVKKLEGIGINRNVSSLIFVSLISILVISTILFFIPLIFKQFTLLIKELLNYLNGVNINLFFDKLNEIGFVEDKIEASMMLLYQHVVKCLGNFSNFLLSNSINIVSTTFTSCVIPILTFYILRDWNKMVLSIKRILPVKHRNIIVNLMSEINSVLEGFLIGQISVCFMLGIYYSVLLYIVELEYGLLIGIIIGLLTIIPYAGSFIGCGITIIASLFQHNGIVPTHLFLLLCIFVSGQFLEGNFVTPKLIGKKVNLHPVWIIFALFAGGCLNGILGVFLAVPVAGTVGVILRFFLKKKELLYDR